MLKAVSKIKSNSFETIKSNGELTMLLLKTYSKLYKEGKQVKTCVNSMLKYYNEILKSGKMKAELKKEIKNRKCIPSFEGRKEIYTKKNGIIMINAYHLTDQDAINLIKDGNLKKEDFKTQPPTQEELNKRHLKEKAEAEKAED